MEFDSGNIKIFFWYVSSILIKYAPYELKIETAKSEIYWAKNFSSEVFDVLQKLCSMFGRRLIGPELKCRF